MLVDGPFEMVAGTLRWLTPSHSLFSVQIGHEGTVILLRSLQGARSAYEISENALVTSMMSLIACGAYAHPSVIGAPNEMA